MPKFRVYLEKKIKKSVVVDIDEDSEAIAIQEAHDQTADGWVVTGSGGFGYGVEKLEEE